MTVNNRWYWVDGKTISIDDPKEELSLKKAEGKHKPSAPHASKQRSVKDYANV